MISSGYTARNLKQSVPPQLQSKLFANDVVVSRNRRVIRPNGAGNGLSAGSVMDFNINSSSEWVDAGTMCLHATITISRVIDGADTNYLNPFPKCGWRNLVSGYTIQCKGQSLETSLDTGGLIAWNALRSRLYESSDKLRTSGQITSGCYDIINKDTGAVSYVYATARTNNTNGNTTYEVSVPLGEIVNFFKLDRSYIPVMAIPLLLRMTLAQVSDCFVSPSGKPFGANYTLDNVYLAGDFLQMDASVDESFRAMVMNSQVSFMYPSVFITNETADGTNVNLKTNLNASNLDAVYFYPTRKPATTDSFYPACTDAIWDKATMKGLSYQFYIDSRNVFSEPINNCAEAFNELQKSIFNDNEELLEGVPVISSSGYIAGIQKNSDLQSNGHYADIAMSVLPVNLSRVLTLNSVSGVNVSLTGGRLSMEVNGLPAEAGRNCLMFYKHTRELVLSADFIQVVT